VRQMALLRESVGKSAAGQVSIGMPPSMQRMVTAPLIERIARQTPEVAIRVHEALNDTLLELMRSSLVDLAVGAFDIAGVRGYRSTPLVREPLLVAGAAAAGLSARQPVALARLRRERLILPSRPNVFRRTAEHSFKRAGHAMPMVIEAETVSLCLELARRGLGYTVMPFCALHENPAGRELSWAPVRGLYVTWALFENESRAGSPAVSGARGELLAQVARLFDRRQWPGAERVPAR